GGVDKPLRIGVLALQGNFREHAAVLRRLGAEPVEVRLPEQLAGLDGLIVPGGESTAIMRLMRLYGLDEALRRFDAPIFGTCAGMIVLDRDHLGLVDIRVQRNAFGRQVKSFEADLDIGHGDEPVRAVFIRAPWIETAGPDVEALTDNRNRTASDVRHTFTKNDGNLGGSGAVSWLFERRGVVQVPAGGVDEDELTLAAAEGGADDVERDGSSYQVTAAPELLASVREAIEGAGYTIDSAELTMIPKTTVEVADESDAKKVLRLVDQLEDNDDVQDVYANFDIPEQVLEAVAG